MGNRVAFNALSWRRDQPGFMLGFLTIILTDCGFDDRFRVEKALPVNG